MDDEIKTAFQAQDERFSTLEKRFDDMKWYFGGVAGVVTAGIAVYSILIGMNFSNERASLQAFKTEMRQDLGKAQPVPEIELLDPSGQPLNGAVVPATIDLDEQKHPQINFATRLRNTGGSSGPIFMKFYVAAPLEFYNSSIDEQGFTSEDYISSKEIEPNEIPGGGYYAIYHHSRSINATVGPGRYPIMFKVYYANTKVASAKFYIDIKNQPPEGAATR